MSDRLTDLEVKLAFAEKHLEDLDDVVRSLSDKVDLLVTEVARLRQVSQREELPPGNEKPPHY